MTLFAGFNSLDTFLEHVDCDRPIYALSITDTAEHGQGVSIQQIAILVSQPGAGGLVNYCRIPTARIELLHGQPLGHDHAERCRRAQNAWCTVLAYFDWQGIVTIPALIAAPKDLQLLDGEAECLHNACEAECLRDACDAECLCNAWDAESLRDARDAAAVRPLEAG